MLIETTSRQQWWVNLNDYNGDKNKANNKPAPGEEGSFADVEYTDVGAIAYLSLILPPAD